MNAFNGRQKPRHRRLAHVPTEELPWRTARRGDRWRVQRALEPDAHGHYWWLAGPTEFSVRADQRAKHIPFRIHANALAYALARHAGNDSAGGFIRLTDIAGRTFTIPTNEHGEATA